MVACHAIAYHTSRVVIRSSRALWSRTHHAIELVMWFIIWWFAQLLDAVVAYEHSCIRPRVPETSLNSNRKLTSNVRKEIWNYKTLRMSKINFWLVVEPTPLKNDGVRQLGSWHSIPHIWKVIIQSCSSHHQADFVSKADFGWKTGTLRIIQAVLWMIL